MTGNILGTKNNNSTLRIKASHQLVVPMESIHCTVGIWSFNFTVCNSIATFLEMLINWELTKLKNCCIKCILCHHFWKLFYMVFCPGRHPLNMILMGTRILFFLTFHMHSFFRIKVKLTGINF
jgi:hypothetical protein